MAIWIVCHVANERAVLFDFDGSLAQSEEAHRKRFVAATGVACDSARWDAECVGRNTEWIVCHLLGVEEPPAEVRALLPAGAAARQTMSSDCSSSRQTRRGLGGKSN